MQRVDFDNGKITENIVRTALPMLAAQVFNLLYSIVDRVYIGRIPGEGMQALGAVGLCFPIISLILGFTNLYGMGGSPLFSIEMGRGNTRKACQIMNTSFRLLGATALLLILLGELFAEPLLGLFGASEQSLTYALPYLRIYLLGTFFSMVTTGMNPFINASGFPGVSMASVVTGAVSNLVLDPVFIFVFNFGVRGAAIATVLSQLLSALVTVGYFRSARAPYKIILKKEARLRDYVPYAKDITGLGTAAFIMQCTNSLVQICCNNVLMRFGGELYVSIMTIVSSVRQVLETPVMALSEGTSPIISYNYGAKRAGHVRKAILIMTGIAVTYTLFAWLIVEWKPILLISIFSTDQTLLDDAVPALHLYFFAFAFQSLQLSGQTVFKSLNKKKKAIFFSVFRKVVIVVPLTLMLPYMKGFGTDGVFMAEPISNVVGGIICFSTMLMTVLPELKRMNAEQSR